MGAGFGGVELRFEVVAVGAELGAALVDVAEQVGVGVVDEFEAADGALDALVGLRDRAAQRRDSLRVEACTSMEQLVHHLTLLERQAQRGEKAATRRR